MLVTRSGELREFRDSGELSDICVVVDDAEFNLHKFPLFLNSEFFRALCRCGMIDQNRVNLTHFPGGAKTFSLVADYCYGVEINIDSSNVVELRCAAEFLQMTSQGNLASETRVAISRMLRSPQSSVTLILDIISSCCRLGAIANQTNVISNCSAAIMEIWKSGDLPEGIVEAIYGLPVEWFLGLVVGARDCSIDISSITSLAGGYLETVVRERQEDVQKCLQYCGGSSDSISETAPGGCTEDFVSLGEIMDCIINELPEDAPLAQVIDGQLLCSLYRLAVRLHCKCESTLLRAVSRKLDTIAKETLIAMPTNDVVTIVEHTVHNDMVSPGTLCETLDKYMWERVIQRDIDLVEFQAVMRVIPKSYREHHDSLLLIAQELFSYTKPCDETKMKVLEVVEPHRLHEQTLRQISERNVIPSSFVVRSALAVSSRLRNELTEAKAELETRDNAMNNARRTVSDVIRGQWEYKNVVLNVTPKNADNTSIQFAKVLPRTTSTDLSMEHETYEGKLTLCVRSTRAAPTQGLFLFEPFNEQLIEIKKSKYDNLMVGENYKKKKHTTAYWPFNDIS